MDRLQEAPPAPAHERQSQQLSQHAGSAVEQPQKAVPSALRLELQLGPQWGEEQRRARSSPWLEKKKSKKRASNGANQLHEDNHMPTQAYETQETHVGLLSSKTAGKEAPKWVLLRS